MDIDGFRKLWEEKRACPLTPDDERFLEELSVKQGAKIWEMVTQNSDWESVITAMKSQEERHNQTEEDDSCTVQDPSTQEPLSGAAGWEDKVDSSTTDAWNPAAPAPQVEAKSEVPVSSEQAPDEGHSESTEDAHRDLEPPTQDAADNAAESLVPGGKPAIDQPLTAAPTDPVEEAPMQGNNDLAINNTSEEALRSDKVEAKTEVLQASEQAPDEAHSPSTEDVHEDLAPIQATMDIVAEVAVPSEESAVDLLFATALTDLVEVVPKLDPMELDTVSGEAAPDEASSSNQNVPAVEEREIFPGFLEDEGEESWDGQSRRDQQREERNREMREREEELNAVVERRVQEEVERRLQALKADALAAESVAEVSPESEAEVREEVVQEVRKEIADRTAMIAAEQEDASVPHISTNTPPSTEAEPVAEQAELSNAETPGKADKKRRLPLHETPASKRKRASPTMAESMLKFQRKTPPRFRSLPPPKATAQVPKPAPKLQSSTGAVTMAAPPAMKPQDKPAPAGKRTEPKPFNLSVTNRRQTMMPPPPPVLPAAHAKRTSSVMRIPSQSASIVRPSQSTSVIPKQRTVPQPFRLSSAPPSSRSSSIASQPMPPPPPFKATPLNRKMFTTVGEMGVARVPKKESTVVKGFSFHQRDLNKQKAKEEQQELQKDKDISDAARPTGPVTRSISKRPHAPDNSKMAPPPKKARTAPKVPKAPEAVKESTNAE